MPKIDYKEIRSWLKPKDISRLLDQEGITRRQMHNRLNGKTRKLDFLEKVVIIALENKRRIFNTIEQMKDMDIPSPNRKLCKQKKGKPR